MKHTWVPYAAVAAGSLLLLETVLIFGTEDEINGGFVVALYFTGLLLALAAAIGFGLSQRRGRRTLVAAGLAVLLVAWVMGLGDLTGPAFEEVFGHHEYVNDEGPVGLLGLVLIALGARGKLGGREPLPA